MRYTLVEYSLNDCFTKQTGFCVYIYKGKSFSSIRVIDWLVFDANFSSISAISWRSIRVIIINYINIRISRWLKIFKIEKI